MAQGFQKYLQSIQKSAAKHRKRVERQFREGHQDWTDDQLMEYLMDMEMTYGRRPKLQEVIGYRYLLDRFGVSWTDLLRMAERWAAKRPSEKRPRPEQVAPIKREIADDSEGRRPSDESD